MLAPGPASARHEHPTVFFLDRLEIVPWGVSRADFLRLLDEYARKRDATAVLAQVGEQRREDDQGLREDVRDDDVSLLRQAVRRGEEARRDAVPQCVLASRRHGLRVDVDTRCATRAELQ